MARHTSSVRLELHYTRGQHAYLMVTERSQDIVQSRFEYPLAPALNGCRQQRSPVCVNRLDQLPQLGANTTVYNTQRDVHANGREQFPPTSCACTGEIDDRPAYVLCLNIRLATSMVHEFTKRHPGHNLQACYRRALVGCTPPQNRSYLFLVEILLGYIEDGLASLFALAQYCRRKYGVSEFIFRRQHFNDLMSAAKGGGKHIVRLLAPSTEKDDKRPV